MPDPLLDDAPKMLTSMAVAVARFDALVDAARHLEAVGLDRAWATELRGRDVFVRAQHMANHTSRIGVGTGIAYAFTRHPMLVAATAVEAQAATGGRFTIGLGAGTPHTRGEFGLTFDHPALRLAEYVAVIRAALEAEGTLEFHGRFYDVSMPGFAFGHDEAVLSSVQIYGAALNPLALKALARVCDGIALHPFGHWPQYLDDVVLASVEQGSEAGSRQPRLAAWYISCALEDADQARDLARAQLALYAAQPGFSAYMDHTPWASVAASIRDNAGLGAGVRPWLDIGRQYVPDEMLDGLAAAGTPADVQRKVAVKEVELAARGVHELVLQVPGVALPAGETLSAVLTLGIAVSKTSSSA
jgi:alkanesulfonate monooxygenase SsuD/methylene tetrahydromethanopterin reductase-like flavin-dependent oxidoreductase (luciferase family)